MRWLGLQAGHRVGLRMAHQACFDRTESSERQYTRVGTTAVAAFLKDKKIYCVRQEGGRGKKLGAAAVLVSFMCGL